MLFNKANIVSVLSAVLLFVVQQQQMVHATAVSVIEMKYFASKTCQGMQAGYYPYRFSSDNVCDRTGSTSSKLVCEEFSPSKITYSDNNCTVQVSKTPASICTTSSGLDYGYSFTCGEYSEALVVKYEVSNRPCNGNNFAAGSVTQTYPVILYVCTDYPGEDGKPAYSNKTSIVNGNTVVMETFSGSNCKGDAVSSIQAELDTCTNIPKGDVLRRILSEPLRRFLKQTTDGRDLQDGDLIGVRIRAAVEGTRLFGQSGTHATASISFFAAVLALASSLVIAMA